MKTLITALALAILIGVPAFTKSAAAASKARRDVGQSGQNYNRAYRNGAYSNGASCMGTRCTGTYEGRPLSEWLRPGTW